MDIKNASMALLQATQSNVSKKDVTKSSTKDSFENVLRQEADQANQTNQADKTQTSQKDQSNKTQDKVQDSKEDAAEGQNGQTEVVKDAVTQFANTEILAAMLFNRNDVNAAMQALQQNQTSVQMSATTETAAIQTVVQENGMSQMAEGTQQMTQTLPQQTLQQSVVQTSQETNDAANTANKTNTTNMVNMTNVETQQQSAVQSDTLTAKTQQSLQEVGKQDSTQQNVQSPIQKDVVIEKADDSQSSTEDLSMLLQTKQQTAEGDVIHVKVSDVVSVSKGDVPEQLADKILMRADNEFELQLTPESLGKVQIKVSFAEGETHVSIFCANAKAMETLMDNRNGLISVLENRTGQNVTVQVQVQEDKDLLQQQNQEQQQQREQSAQEQKKNQQQKQDDSMDFLQQLRLGLV